MILRMEVLRLTPSLFVTSVNGCVVFSVVVVEAA